MSVFQPRADPGPGGDQPEDLAEEVRPDLRAEPHLPLSAAGGAAAAGVQAQEHGGGRAVQGELSFCIFFFKLVPILITKNR